MALLHACARATPRAVSTVATFDHGTGPAASRAAGHVAREAARLGLPVVIGHARGVGGDRDDGGTEAAWRQARREFLRDVAGRTDATVVTAHTRDDQIETVLMRVLRDAGARGLAGLYASGDTARPLLEFSREEVAAYADSVGACWVEDPTNASSAFLRNRVRRDLLPALTRADPELDAALLDAARRAAAWRARVDGLVAEVARRSAGGERVSVAVRDFAAYSREELTVLWPALAATIGLAMDWRGTERAAAFTKEGRVGGWIPLSGGWEITRLRESFELRRVRETTIDAVAALAPGTRWNRWRFDATMGASAASDEWVAQLPRDVALTVRCWRPGDRMRLADGVSRKVKRFLSDSGVSGALRGRWPVVIAGEEIVWIPGVRRSDAAAVRPGRPGVLYRCELDDR